MTKLLSLLALSVSLGGCVSLESCAPVNTEASKADPTDPPTRKGRKANKKRDRAEARARKRGEQTQQNVVFIVLDTVRSASMSLCGYERPTTPYLDKLAAQDGWSHTCEAYSPATWTIPSHASYFTGLSVPEHESDAMGQTFGEEIPVLSELLKEKGYETAMMSANPTLREESGLQRGFDHVVVEKGLMSIRGKTASRRVRSLLEEVDPSKPLFMFINLIDAHDPYPAIPAGIDWVPERPRLRFGVHKEGLNETYHQYIRGELEEQVADDYLAAVRDGYDWGIHEVDDTLEGVLQVLRKHGILDDARVIITSDHGEFIGEHRLLRHGCFTWEPVTKVPFLYMDTRAEQPLAMDGPFSATNSFFLARDGALPAEPVPVASYSKERVRDPKKGADMAALHTHGDQKVYWMNADLLQTHLQTDPGELDLQPLPETDPVAATIKAMGEAHAEHLERVRSKDDDADMLKALEELGYLE